MKHLILKGVILLLLFSALIMLVSCSTEKQVHRIAKKNKCPQYRGAYAKWLHKNKKYDQTHIMTKK